MLLAHLFLAAVAAFAAPATCYRHPVDAVVVQPFDAPACRWCPGNRGLDYGTAPGVPVRAAAAGRVTFAGSVAGARWVTISHADGLRTSYGPLSTIAVRRGHVAAGGDVVGRTGGRLHVGLRRGETYLDPARLFGPPVRLRPRLVPLAAPAPPGPASSCPAPRRSRTAVR